jgi:hypothetical protein
MNKKGISKIVVVGIIVVILVVSAVGVYLAMSGDGDDSENGDGGVDTTNGDTTNGETENGDNGDTADNGNGEDGEADGGVAEANSVRFKVTVDPVDSESLEYTYMIKNAETSDMMMRVEMESAGEEMIYIINRPQQKVWVYSGGQWIDFSNTYQTYWDTWNSAWEGYRTNLLDWTGGDWTYTTPDGDSVRIYDIDIDPSLADSLFQH